MNITTILLHHSSVSYDKNPNQFEANNRYHKKWNFKSSLGFYLGYNYEISKDGITRQARREGERTVACWQQGMNTGKAIHICLDGNFSIQAPTLQQEKSLTKLLKELKLKYPDAEILHHRDIKATQCPGNFIPKSWHKNLISNNKKMEYVEQGGEQYIRYTEPFKIALNIGDNEELQVLKNKGLPDVKPITVIDMNEYEVYPLVSKARMAIIVKELKDLMGF